MNAFMTGSRVYGTAHEKSDLDLVVLVSDEELNTLRTLADGRTEVARPPAGGSLSAADRKADPGDSLYFGKLNLICHTRPLVFEAWRAATDVLRARKPVAREDAVKEIKARVLEALRATPSPTRIT